MRFRKMKMLERGDQFHLLRLKTRPANPMIRCLARKEWIGCNRNSKSTRKCPLNQRRGFFSPLCIGSQSWENVIVEIIDYFNKFLFRNSQSLVEFRIKDFLESMSRIFAFIHQICSTDKRWQQHI